MTTCPIEVDRQVRELPALEGGTGGGGFAFGLYKAGSSLLYRTLRQLARNSNLRFVDVLQQFRQAGVVLETSRFSQEGISALRNYLAHNGVIFGGWREFPVNYELPLDPSTRTYLLIRDPRDMITSHYFSLKYSHIITGPDATYILPERERLQRIDIDSFARAQTRLVAAYFARYEALERTKLMLRRYEDIISDRPKFVGELCTHFEIDVPPRKRQVVAERNAEVPAAEDVYSHIRQVTPGDHARKLSGETIAFLNEELGGVLRKYGYA